MTAPRGIRNCNPGNIVWNKHNDWDGQLPPDERYCRFTTPEKGIRAMAKTLASYQRRGLNTLQDIINRWAPPFENETSDYVRSVCYQTGLDANCFITVLDYPRVIAAIIHHENGMQPYEPEVIAEGIRQACLST